MGSYFDGLGPVRKALYKIANLSLLPAILSIVGLSLLGAPHAVQRFLWNCLPVWLKEHMLMLLSANGWLVLILLLSIFFAVWGGVGSHTMVNLLKKKYRRVLRESEALKAENESKNIDSYKFFSNYLYGYYKRLGLGVDERVSLYRLDMEMFSCVGRYSDNEYFKSKPNRLYPKNEGCIAMAWEKGIVQDADAPDPGLSIEDWKAYNVEKFNFSPETVDRIKMCSRAFLGVRLKNTQKETVGVLMFESTKNDGIPFGKVRRFFSDHETRNVAHLIDSLDGHIPSLEAANAEGF